MMIKKFIKRVAQREAVLHVVDKFSLTGLA